MKPIRSSRLLDDETEFKTITEELWGTTTGPRAYRSEPAYHHPYTAEPLPG